MEMAEQQSAVVGEVASREGVAWLDGARIAKGDHLVLQDVNLKISRGDFIYLVGRVGSGKSSLIETLTGQIPLAGGEGYVCGFSLRKLRRKQIPYLRRSIGVVFQDFKLLMDRSVEKNLQFVLRATGWRDKHEIAHRIEESLSLVGLTHKMYKLPNQLSGGEQQRVAIARAILNEPQLVLADEPTGNLDPETSEGIMQLLLQLSKNGKSVVMATHNFGLVGTFPAPTYQCANMTLQPVATQAQLDFSDVFPR